MLPGHLNAKPCESLLNASLFCRLFSVGVQIVSDAEMQLTHENSLLVGVVMTLMHVDAFFRHLLFLVSSLCLSKL